MCHIVFYFLLVISLSPAGVQVHEPQPERGITEPHFVEAISRARRLIAVVEPVYSAEAEPTVITTGVFVNPEGGVITSIAAVAGAEEIFVRRLHRKRTSARIKAVDQALGLVFLETAVIMDPATFDTVDGPGSTGEWVIVTYAGDAVGEDDCKLSVFPAIITSTDSMVKFSGRDYGPVLRLNSRAPEGSAAAPVFNSRGFMEGLLVAISGCHVAGCSYILPEEKLAEVAAKLQEGISTRLGWMGVALRRPSCRQGGVEIAAVMHGCPADEAGLKTGDIILSINGDEIDDPVKLQSVISGFSPGQKISVGFERDGDYKTTDLELEARPLMICAPGR